MVRLYKSSVQVRIYSLFFWLAVTQGAGNSKRDWFNTYPLLEKMKELSPTLVVILVYISIE